MPGDVVYADLKLPGCNIPPAERQRAPAVCPRWHRVLLRVGCLGHCVLLALVVVLSLQVSDPGWVSRVRAGPPREAVMSAPLPAAEAQGRDDVETGWRASAVKYFCRPGQQSPPGCPGCPVCPNAWLLHKGRCYWLSKETGKWLDAKKYCEQEGSQLLDDKEQEIIKLFNENTPIWIELRSSDTERQRMDSPPFTMEALKEDGCWTRKGEDLERDTCDGDLKWVCEKRPFQLAAVTPGKGQHCGAAV